MLMQRTRNAHGLQLLCKQDLDTWDVHTGFEYMYTWVTKNLSRMYLPIIMSWKANLL